MSDVPMTRPEEMLAIHHTKYFHSSTFVELDGGRILHAANTTFTTSDDGGITWSDEFSKQDKNGDPVGGSGTGLCRLSGKGIGLIGMWRNPDLAKARTETYSLFWRSEDQGETWEPPTRITPPGIVGHAYQDVLLRTSSGRLILPVYLSMGQGTGPNDEKPPTVGRLINAQWVSTSAHFFDPHFSAVYVMYSDDEGRTWQRNSDGELTILMDWNATFSYVNEPVATEVSPGKLLMFMRTGLGRMYQAWSYNDGETWTRPQPTSLAASTTPCQLRTLPNGHLLVVWNQEGPDEIRRGYNRQRISSAISRNGGSVWEHFQNIESLHEGTRLEPGPIEPVRPAEYHFYPGIPAPEREVQHVVAKDYYARFSYPSVFVMKDRVLVTVSFQDYSEHPTKGELVPSRSRETGTKEFDQKLRVLPMSWFYGGKEPADNPALPRA